MRFRNSVRLLMGNFKNAYKILFYNLVVMVITGALAAALVYPGLRDIIKSDEMAALFRDIKGFFKALVNGNSEYLAGFKAQFTGAGGTVRSLVALLRSQLSNIVFAVIGIVFIYLVARFLNTLCFFTMGDLLDDRMASYGETKFSDSYIRNLGRASIYSVAYVPIVFAFDALMILACYFLFFYLFDFLGLLVSLFLSVTFIVILQAFKLTWTSMWLPAMVTDKQTLRQAMSQKDKTTRKQRKSIFLTYVTTVYIVIIMNVAAGLFTVGSALLVTIPASYFLFICQQFVNYYTVKGKKYFVSYESVVVNPSYGRRDGFFAAMENATLESVGAAEEKKAEQAKTQEDVRSEKTEA